MQIKGIVACTGIIPIGETCTREIKIDGKGIGEVFLFYLLIINESCFPVMQRYCLYIGRFM